MDFTQIDLSKLMDLGATAIITLVFIWHVSNKDRQFTKIIGNHINHSTEVMNGVCSSVKELTNIIKELKDSLKK